MVRERLMYFLGVEVAAANKLAAEQQDRNLVAIAAARHGVTVHVDDVDAELSSFRQQLQGEQHVLAQTAIGSRIEQESRFHARRRVNGARARCR